MTPRKRDDKMLDDYLEGRSVLSGTYRAGARDEPSAALDAKILAESRRALTPTRRWAIPLSAAATILLATGLGIVMTREGINPIAPAPVTSEPPVVAKTENAMRSSAPTPALRQADSMRKRAMKAEPAVGPAHTPDSVADETAGFAAKPAAPVAETAPAEVLATKEREGVRLSATGKVAGSRADVLGVTVTGKPGAYQFIVTVRSGDRGCAEYADWWEVVSEDGQLLYRHVLAHSHVDEQPFVREGGPVPVAADTVVWIRAHMQPGGYTGSALRGSISAGFAPAAATPGFAASLADEGPRPEHCAF